MRHDVVAVRLTDPLETRLPDLGLMTFQDAESGEQLFVDTHDAASARRFAAAADAREEALRAVFEKCRRGCGGTGHRGRCDGRADPLCRDAQAEPAQVGMKGLDAHPPGRAWGLCSQHLLRLADVAWLLLLVPLMIAGYILLLRRRKQRAFRYPNLALVKQAAQGPAGAGMSRRR